MTNGTEISSIVLFGLIAIFFIWMGWKKGFFSFSSEPWFAPLNLFHVLAAFAIYIVGSLLAGTIYSSFFKTAPNSTGMAVWFNFLTSGTILIFLMIYWGLLPSTISLWRRPSVEEHLYKEDIFQAFLAWFISFPIVLFISNFLEYFVAHVFHAKQLPDQLAVQFLKLTFGKPLYFVLAIASIILIAPLLEELLFRGFLQSFIRKHLGSKYAILITSVCFAFFHYSGDQGLGNIPIIGSLICLALFLGFLYEKQGSLFAPVALHASFNAISVLNLYFLGGVPGGI